MTEVQKELDLSYRYLLLMQEHLRPLHGSPRPAEAEEHIESSSRLMQLDLSGNQLRNLPTSLSFLRELVFLDLSDNPIHSLKMVLEGISTIPKLQELKIHLKAKIVGLC